MKFCLLFSEPDLIIIKKMQFIIFTNDFCHFPCGIEPIAHCVPLCSSFERFPTEFSQESRVVKRSRDRRLPREEEKERKKKMEQVPRGSCILFRARRLLSKSADANRRWFTIYRPARIRWWSRLPFQAPESSHFSSPFSIRVLSSWLFR